MRKLLIYPALGLLWVYKYTLSPVLYFFGVRCRHDPSCSSYAMSAIKGHGFWAGGWMTLGRLSRCHPVKWLGATDGVDNVPETITKPPLWAPWRYGLWRTTYKGENHDHDHIS